MAVLYRCAGEKKWKKKRKEERRKVVGDEAERKMAFGGDGGYTVDHRIEMWVTDKEGWLYGWEVTDGGRR